MSLSNIETPYYYGKFRDDVLDGKIVVCKEVSMEMNRIDSLILDPRYYYYRDGVDGWVEFCEKELTLSDGGDLYLLDTFKLWGEQLFGWYYPIEQSVFTPDEDGGHYENKELLKRLINVQYLIVARGAAKSMYDYMIQSYFLNVDTTTTQQITVAPTMQQAEEVMMPMRTSITRARGPYYKFLTEGSLQNTTGSKANRVKLASTKKGIQNFLNGSTLEVRPMQIDKLQGRKDRVATVDEWLSCDIRENPIEAIEQGASKNFDYMILATSSEGTVRNGVGDSIKMMLTDILKGDIIDPHVSIWWYRLDDIKEVNNPLMWIKANPNLGKTVTYETYHRAVEKSEHSPADRNDIIAKRFGIPLEGYTYFFTYDETIPHRHREFWSLPCALGIDLSRGDDFCAFTLMFPLKDGSFGVKAKSYISDGSYQNLITAMYEKYQDFVNEGSLVIMNGSVLDMMEVYDDFTNWLDTNNYDVRCLGYDPYNAKGFIERWESENSGWGIVKVPQGARTESVPLGELKILAENRELLFDQEIMKFCMGNCITIQDTNGNRKLYKDRRDKKIDNVAAMMDAWISYGVNQDAFE